ncbi:hypothetical protein [Kribbella sp. NPDC051770]|uniref:Imm32 family immunity protein n=1 Tax=Kribbella sp. NPDC051770 TaxID=3155413 RepID=UPI0034211077
MELGTYGPTGLTFIWNDDFEITVDTTSPEVVIAANPAGLTSLARHLLTLAQEGVPDGAHLHLTAGQELTSTVDLILERRASTDA